MGGVCCAGRDDAAAKATAKAIKKDKKGDDNDAALFDEAFVNKDVRTMVSLLKSTTKFVPFEGNLHPWAAQPTTVGALAMAQLSIMASKGEANALEVLKEKETLEILVNLLQDKDLSKLQGALVGLTVLTQDKAVCSSLQKTQCMERVAPRMDSDIDGERSSAGQICRNLYANVDGNDQRKRFVGMGGVKKLIKLLEVPAGTEATYTQLEAVYHLEDLCFVGQGISPKQIDNVPVPGMVEEVMKEPVVATLEALLESCDEETTEEVNFLLGQLKQAV